MTQPSELLAMPRWAGLSAFVRRWYQDPLVPDSGCTELEVAAAEESLGVSLPSVLREWYQLVGRRLRAVQDTPTPLDKLTVENGRVCVWAENQWVWRMLVPLEGDDPIAQMDGPRYQRREANTSETLKGMLVSDTLVGAWAGHGYGPLGALAPGVVGGFPDDLPAEVFEHVKASFPSLPWPNNPFYSEPYRGTDSIIVRTQEDSFLEWMTADAASYGQVAELLALDPPGGPQELVVAVQGLPTERLSGFLSDSGGVDVDRFQQRIGDLGHLHTGMVSPTKGLILLHVATSRPEDSWKMLAPELADELADGFVTVAVRPANVVRFKVLHPPRARQVRTARVTSG